MKAIRTPIIYLLIYILFINNILLLSTCKKSFAAFEVQGVQLFKDNNICLFMAESSIPESLNIVNFTVTSESVQSKISSSGSLCPPPPFFSGGALFTTTNGISIQADPTVQSLGRGILISEPENDKGAFSSLISRLGGVTLNIFEISLPKGCDVIDDDDDVFGSSADLSTVNDFSFPTCTSTTGITVACNDLANGLTGGNGLVVDSGNTPAKIRFTISGITTAADGNMVDSILIRLDSQDIFCPNNTEIPLTVTVVAKNTVDNPTITETIGSTTIGTVTQAAKLSYAYETAISTKGEISTNAIDTTPVLTDSNNTIANNIQIEELDKQSIPIGGQSSSIIINPSSIDNSVISEIKIFLIPSNSNLFTKAPSGSDITFSDNSLILSSTPYIVMSSSDDLVAPFGAIVIPVKQNPQGIDSSTTKTIITVKSLALNGNSSVSKDSIVSLSFFEPISGAIVNTPGALSIFSTSNTINPQNFSSFTPSSARALAQNAISNGIVAVGSGANQITTDTDLTSLTARDTILGTPQITTFTNIVSSLTPIDTNKITISNSDSVITITGDKGASIGGAKIKIDSVPNGQTTVFDSVTITSKNDGSFNAKLKGDFSKNSNLTVSLKQIVSNSESEKITKVVLDGHGDPTCFESLCGSCDTSCIPTITNVLTFIQDNGGLSQVVLSGGMLLQEVIKTAKKALGLT